MLGYFDDIETGQVVQLGALPLSEHAVRAFCKEFAPDWDAASGVPEAMLYAVWSRLDEEASRSWPQTKRLAVDALRWTRSPRVGELVRARLTVMGKDPVGDGKGIVIAQNDLLDESGRLLFSCLTRCVFARSTNA